MKLEDQQHYESLEEKVDGKAMERFRRPAYSIDNRRSINAGRKTDQ